MNLSSASNWKIEWSKCDTSCLSGWGWVTVPNCEHLCVLVVSISEIDTVEVLDSDSWIGGSRSYTLLFLSSKVGNTIIGLILHIIIVYHNTFIIILVGVSGLSTSHCIRNWIAAESLVSLLIVSLSQLVSVLVLAISILICALKSLYIITDNIIPYGGSSSHLNHEISFSALPSEGLTFSCVSKNCPETWSGTCTSVSCAFEVEGWITVCNANCSVRIGDRSTSRNDCWSYNWCRCWCWSCTCSWEHLQKCKRRWYWLIVITVSKLSST